MTDDKGVGVKEQMYSDVMTDTQISRMSGYSDGYNAGRKAERERCARIVAEYDHECGMIDRDSVLEDIRGGQDGK